PRGASRRAVAVGACVGAGAAVRRVRSEIYLATIVGEAVAISEAGVARERARAEAARRGGVRAAADGAARAAVTGAGVCVRLATVVLVAVAVSEAPGADRCAHARDAARRSVRVRAGDAAAAAVVDVRSGGRLAAVLRVAVTVGEAGVARGNASS